MLCCIAVTPTYAQSQSGKIIDNPTELQQGEVVRVEGGKVRQLAFAPDEAVLAVATSAGLWLYGPTQSSNGQLLDKAPVQALWWSADGTLLAALADDGVLQIWQVALKKSLTTITGASAIASVAWAPNSSQLATGSVDGMIEVWSLSNNQRLQTLEGHTGRINNLHWFADGTQLVSAADDGTVRAWQVQVAAPSQPTPTNTPTPRPIITATVQADTLNVRTGPATTFERIGTAKRGERLIVIGQTNNCAWLQVKTANNLQGWVAATNQFVTLSSDCSALAAPAATSVITPVVSLQITPTATTALVPTATPVAAALPTPLPPSPTPVPTTPADPFPPDKGCFLFQNQLGPELTVTITGGDGTFNQTFKVPDTKEVPYCLSPGHYSYTIDAPPPWADINGTLDAKAGDRFLFPIRPRQ
jgi:uncharacterized protein YgiM (DUF1202 family)